MITENATFCIESNTTRSCNNVAKASFSISSWFSLSSCHSVKADLA